MATAVERLGGLVKGNIVEREMWDWKLAVLRIVDEAVVGLHREGKYRCGCGMDVLERGLNEDYGLVGSDVERLLDRMESEGWIEVVGKRSSSGAGVKVFRTGMRPMSRMRTGERRCMSVGQRVQVEDELRSAGFRQVGDSQVWTRSARESRKKESSSVAVVVGPYWVYVLTSAVGREWVMAGPLTPRMLDCSGVMN